MKINLKSRKFWLVTCGLWLVACGLVVGDQVMSQEKQRIIDNTKQVSSSSQVPQKCSENIRVKLGNHFFMIPRHPLTTQMKESEYLHIFPCAQKAGEAVEVTSFSFPADIGDIDRTHERYAGFSVFLSARLSVEKAVPQDTYEEAINRGWLNRKQNHNHLNIENGYYILPTVYDQYMLIPLDSDFKTPNKNPVVFKCYLSSVGGKDIHYCGTSIKWEEGIELGIGRISLAMIPKAKLKEFYYTAFDYLQHARQKTEQKEQL